MAQRLLALSKQLKQMVQIEHTIVDNLKTGQKQSSWLFTSVAEDLN